MGYSNYLTSYKAQLKRHITEVYQFSDTRAMTASEVKALVDEMLSSAVPIPSESVDWLRNYFSHVQDRNELLVYDNTNGLWHFENSDQAIRNLLTDYFTMISEEAEKANSTIFVAYARAFFGANRIPLMAQRLKTSISFLERRSHDIFNRVEHLRYFQTTNGKRALIDLTSPKFNLRVAPFSETQEMKLMHISPVPISITDEDPKLWLKLIEDYMMNDPERIEYFHKALAYMMSPYNYNQAYIYFLGDGRNGKGTVIKVIQDILGPYTVRMNADLLNANPPSSFKKDDALAASEGRSLLVFNEIDERMVASTQNLKDLTEGGRDEFGNKIMTVVRPAYRPNYEINICGTPLIIANNLLNFSDWSLIEPIFKRLVLIPFDYKIVEEDPTILNRLAAEYPLIQSWLYRNYFKYKGIRIKNEPKPAAVQRMFVRYQQDSDILKMFWDECVLLTNSASDEMLRGDIYRMYKTYCESNGRKPIRNKGTNGFHNLSEKFLLQLRIVNRSGNYYVTGIKPSPYYLDDVSKL